MKFWKLEHAGGTVHVASFPGPAQLCRLQYGKAGEGLV